MFSALEKKQYSRHFLLEEVGVAGQEKLKTSRVLVIGAGGLGCPVLQYLTAAGVGCIGIIDGDVVDQSNLQRQILFGQADIGKPKAICAKNRLQANNPFIDFKVYNEYLSTENALSLFRQYDVIVDGSDNFQTRYLSNDAAVLAEKPLVFGAIFKFEGQVSVFNFRGGATYRCLFPSPPPPNTVPTCTEAGVLGVLPGIIGCLQANEVLKISCGLEGVLSGKLLSIDVLGLENQLVSFSKNPHIKVDKLVNYDQFCGVAVVATNDDVDYPTLKKMLAQANPPLLVDVREAVEREAFHIGGKHVPLGVLPHRVSELSAAAHVVCYCASGGRSAMALRYLKAQYPHKKIQHLKSGVDSLND